ncbi:MAG: hypothetical protein EOM36_01730 [Bacteroidia bacterium]|nr:hypothetical protein [Bacteroidia bacterium]
MLYARPTSSPGVGLLIVLQVVCARQSILGLKLTMRTLGKIANIPEKNYRRQLYLLSTIFIAKKRICEILFLFENKTYMKWLYYKIQWCQIRKKIEEIEYEIRKSHPGPTPSKLMCDLLVVGEDHRISLHPGFDPIALCRALWKTFFGKKQGGSTIAMQIIRTITGNYEVTFLRKIEEIIFAVLLTLHKNKKDLPKIYLWIAYYGTEMNNFRQACLKLNINTVKEKPLESARLVSMLKYPLPRNPNQARMRQIENRAKHLLLLLNKRT